MCSSPIVVSEKSTGLPGDCEVGSGEVPQEELGPLFEFEDTEGELYDVLWPVLIVPLAESVLDLDAWDSLLLKRVSNGELFPTLSRIEGLKRPEKLDMSPPSICAGVCVKPPREPLLVYD